MPVVIRRLGLADAGRRERHADHARGARTRGARRREPQIELVRPDCAANGAPEKICRDRFAPHAVSYPTNLLGGDAGPPRQVRRASIDEIDLTLIAAERERINDLYCDAKLTDEARRRLERELDLREANVENSRDEE